MNIKPFVLKNSILTDRDKDEQMSECEEGDVQVIYIQSQFHGSLSSEVVKHIVLSNSIWSLYGWFFWQAFVPSMLTEDRESHA